MNINDYFNPVSLERPLYTILKNEHSFSHSIDIHTPDNPVKTLRNYQIAIIGVGEEQNGFRQGTAEAPDKIREKLYLLSYVGRNTRVVDLGNLRITGNINDTYYALRDILLELNEMNITALIFGGSQDITLGMSMAYNRGKSVWNLTSFDSKLDFGYGREKLNSRNYLDLLLREKSASRLNFVHVGHQTYMCPQKVLDRIDNLGHECLRLGIVRNGMEIIEPILRDSDLVSVDVSCVRQSDAPGVSLPGPNGFSGEELCQIARYSGASKKVKAFGFFEVLPKKDFNEQTSHLVAQAAWYFMEGYSHCKEEDPREGNSIKYLVEASAAGDHIVFYKSQKTDRWWFELPVKDVVQDKNHLISCTQDDYNQACNGELPERWWKRMRRYS